MLAVMDELRYTERVAVARLHALLELLPTALDRELATTGVTSFEFTLLEALHEADAGRLRLTALATRTNSSLPRLSRVVTSLERKGFVRRAPCAEDGRATNAILTPAGEDAFTASHPVYNKAVRGMILNDLDEEEVGQLADLSLSILHKLDPQGRFGITTDTACAADPAPGSAAQDSPECPADPVRAP